MASDLAAELHSLSDPGVFIGTSSWKHPGWIGDIYTSALYETRGKFHYTVFFQPLWQHCSPAVFADFREAASRHYVNRR